MPPPRLTDRQAVAVLAGLRARVTPTDLAERYGVSISVIEHIRTGRSYARATGLPQIKRKRKSPPGCDAGGPSDASGLGA